MPLNIISNCCAGGFIYRDFLKIKYQNPFIWNLTYDDDILKLIDLYDTINFNNIKLIRFKDFFSADYALGAPASQYNFLCGIEIDNKIKIFWPHNYYDPNCKKPTIRNYDNNIYYYKNYQLTIDNYMKRLNRNNSKPVFLLLTQNKLLNLNTATKICKLQNKNIIIITQYKELLKFNSRNIKIIFYEKINQSPLLILKDLYNELNFTFE